MQQNYSRQTIEMVGQRSEAAGQSARTERQGGAADQQVERQRGSAEQ